MDKKLTLQAYGPLIESIPDPALIVDRDGAIVQVSPIAELLLDPNGTGLAGRSVHELVPKHRRDGHAERMEGFWNKPMRRRMGERDFSVRRLDDSLFPADIMLAPLALQEGPMVLCVIRDLTEQKAQENKLKAALERERRLALSDPLVGVANSRHLHLAMEHEIEQLRRHGRAFTLIYLDLDEFKPLNDQFGHAEGDRALIALGEELQRIVRKTDLVARVGGDEFVVMMIETPSGVARKRVPEFHAAVSRFLSDSPWAITASVGAAVFNAPPESVQNAISRADSLMLRVKRQGRDGCLAHYGDPDTRIESCDLRPGLVGSADEFTTIP